MALSRLEMSPFSDTVMELVQASSAEATSERIVGRGSHIDCELHGNVHLLRLWMNIACEQLIWRDRGRFNYCGCMYLMRCHLLDDFQGSLTYLSRGCTRTFHSHFLISLTYTTSCFQSCPEGETRPSRAMILQVAAGVAKGGLTSS